MKRSLQFLSLLLAGAASGADQATPEQMAFFEKKIRPVLIDKCYKCHNAADGKTKGGLALDTRDGIRRGGDSGAAVAPGSLDDSLLIEAIRYQNSDLAMPPKKEGGKLADAVIKDFEDWIKMGAPDPREGDGSVAEASSGGKQWSDYAEATKWWAWQLPQKPAVPAPRDSAWAKSDIDRFILAGLEAKDMKPVSDADPASLLRRLYFDLIGLPPGPKEAIDFVKAWKENPQSALEKAVDVLLASPQFGERWGRHWLDVARYAESSGKDVNNAFPHAWRYRDYVIASFNADKPYDEFLREQIAGDLLPAKDEKEKAEHLVATGFLAVGTKSLNEQNPAQFALDLADEQIDALSQSLLATTISCARCHDHKFDPIPQREYYALAGIFLSTDTRYGTATNIQNRHATELIELPATCGLTALTKKMAQSERTAKEEELAKLKEERDEFIREAQAARRGGGQQNQNNNGAQNLRRLFVIARIGALEAELGAFDAKGDAKFLCMGAVDQPEKRQLGNGVGDFIRRRLQERFNRPPQFAQIADAPLYVRGDVEKPSDRVPRGFISVLTKGDVPVIPKTQSGRRELADWIVSPGNPLTARVMVNRVWHWLFGQGLVTSVDNFGTTGAKPSNQQLLDYLALHFREENKWSVKKLIREIVMSRAYQLGSGHDDKNFHADPENTLCWKMNKRRLDAECIRDAMLAVSSELDLRPPVGSTIAYSGDGVIGGPRLGGLREEWLENSKGNFRSVYLPVARDVLPEALALFDFAETSLVTGSRDSTNVPSQALFLMNSQFATDRAEKFAEKLLGAYPSASENAGVADRLKERVQWAYSLCYSRWPTPAELQAAQTFFSRFPRNWEPGSEAGPGGIKDKDAIKAAWTSFCRALFASAEFRYTN